MAISCRILSVATIGGRPDWLGPVSRREGSAPRDAGMGNGPHPCAQAGREPILMGLTGGFVAPRCAPNVVPSPPSPCPYLPPRIPPPMIRVDFTTTQRGTSLQTHPRQPLMGRGRGNLRENREDPAPTVGRSEDAIAIQMLSHCRRHAHTVHPACPHLRRPYGFYNGAPHHCGLR